MYFRAGLVGQQQDDIGTFCSIFKTIGQERVSLNGSWRLRTFRIADEALSNINSSALSLLISWALSPLKCLQLNEALFSNRFSVLRHTCLDHLLMRQATM